MFKQLLSGLSKFFTKERVLIIFIFIILSWILLSYSNTKSSGRDGFTDNYTNELLGNSSIPSSTKKLAPSTVSDLPSSVQQKNITPSSFTEPKTLSSSNNVLQKPVITPSDLLPKDENSHWSALNPSSMTKGNLLPDLLLQPGYHIGIDTIGQTLRNPNLQLRSDPLIPKQDVGPWNLSTIEPDVGRVPLEIG